MENFKVDTFSHDSSQAKPLRTWAPPKIVELLSSETNDGIMGAPEGQHTGGSFHGMIGS